VFIRNRLQAWTYTGFFNKWMQDLADSQTQVGKFPMVAPYVLFTDHGPTAADVWSDAGIICPGRFIVLRRSADSSASLRAMARYNTFLRKGELSKRHTFGEC
jgi:hypothetical protein